MGAPKRGKKSGGAGADAAKQRGKAPRKTAGGGGDGGAGAGGGRVKNKAKYSAEGRVGLKEKAKKFRALSAGRKAAKRATMLAAREERRAKKKGKGGKVLPAEVREAVQRAKADRRRREVFVTKLRIGDAEYENAPAAGCKIVCKLLLLQSSKRIVILVHERDTKRRMRVSVPFETVREFAFKNVPADDAEVPKDAEAKIAFITSRVPLFEFGVPAADAPGGILYKPHDSPPSTADNVQFVLRVLAARCKAATQKEIEEAHAAALAGESAAGNQQQKRPGSNAAQGEGAKRPAEGSSPHGKKSKTAPAPAADNAGGKAKDKRQAGAVSSVAVSPVLAAAQAPQAEPASSSKSHEHKEHHKHKEHKHTEKHHHHHHKDHKDKEHKKHGDK